MADWLAALVEGTDGPRPLPSGLVARLETAFDAPELAGVDEPRILPVGLRHQLEESLVLVAPRRTWPTWPVAAAAAVTLVMALIGVAVHSSSGTSGIVAGRAGNGSVASADSGQATLPTVAAAGTTAAGTAAAGASPSIPGGTTGGAAGSVAGTTAGAATTGAGTGGSPAAVATGGATTGPAPQISTVSPAAGPVAGGTRVTLTGAALGRAVAVKFGSTPARSFAIRSDTALDAVSPASAEAGPVAISVTTSSGTATASGFEYVAPPAVSSISPPNGPSSGGTWITIQGQNLRLTTHIAFGDVAATRVKIDSDSQIEALSPPHDSGVVDVTVATPGGTSGSTPGDRYVYLV